MYCGEMANMAPLNIAARQQPEADVRLHTWAKLLAVRRVTVSFTGPSTAGCYNLGQGLPNNFGWLMGCGPCQPDTMLILPFRRSAICEGPPFFGSTLKTSTGVVPRTVVAARADVDPHPA